MTDNPSNEATVELLINGIAVHAKPHMTIIEAAWAGGVPRVTGVGCLEGVCGSCRIMLKRGNDVGVALACETFVGEGIEALFLPAPASIPHRYELTDLADGWDIQARFHKIFPEASHCRHCHGCVKSCPKGIAVEDGVRLAATGRFREASETFFECVMCELCDSACPEQIVPSHVGLFSRRTTAYFHLRPPNLIQRLEENRKNQSSDPATDKKKETP